MSFLVVSCKDKNQKEHYIGGSLAKLAYPYRGPSIPLSWTTNTETPSGVWESRPNKKDHIGSKRETSASPGCLRLSFDRLLVWLDRMPNARFGIP